MKIYKILATAAFAFSAIILPSCSNDQDDIFDESSSVRLQKYLNEAKSTLVNSEDGWIFDYFPNRELSYGGFVYILKFTDNNVTVRSELFPEKVETSLYKLTDDNGPMISFDSYNDMLHYFATPSSGEYEAKDGDFEFIIQDFTDDLITLRGKRTGNVMYMHRFSGDAETYIAEAAKVSDSQIVSLLTGTIGGNNVDCVMDIDTHYMEFSWGDGEDETAGEFFMSIPNGIRFIKPVNVNGTEISEMDYVYNEADKTATYSAASINLSGSVPANYTFMDEFEGDFIFNFNGNKNVNVTIECDKLNREFKIIGVNENYSLWATYDKAHGSMSLTGQYCYFDEDGEYQIMFLPGTSSGFTVSSEVGQDIAKDPNNPGTMISTPNAEAGAGLNSFVIVQYVVAEKKYYLPPTEYRIGGEYQIADIKLIKR